MANYNQQPRTILLYDITLGSFFFGRSILLAGCNWNPPSSAITRRLFGPKAFIVVVKREIFFSLPPSPDPFQQIDFL